MSQGGTDRNASGGGGGGGITQINGDTGSTTGPIVSFTTNPGSGVTSSFTVSGTTATLNISASTTGFTWLVVTGDTTMNVNTGYIANSAFIVTLTMPVSAAVGDIIEVCGTGGSWVVSLNAGQLITYNSSTAFTSISSTSSNGSDSLRILCTTANTQFLVLSGDGNPTIV
jgi:hypothetical protein